MESSFDIYDHKIQDAPYGHYAWLRDQAPLFHNEEFDYWVLSRHADVAAALRDDATFSNKMGVSIDASAWNEYAHTAMSFLAMDPPETTRLRRLVSRAFTPRRVRELEPRIREISQAYLAGLRDRADADGSVSFDWIGDFAGLLPMDIISEMMGVPAADRVEVRRLADLLVHREDGLRDVPPAGIEASLALYDYYKGMIEERRKNPTDDLTSALLLAEDEGKRMTDSEINGFLFLMVVAGNETTTKLLGNAVYHLTRHPRQLDEVFADPATPLVDPWIEETLRFDTSSQFLARLVVQDFEVDGVTAPAGAQLLLALGAANHDDRVFTEPDRYDVHRDPDEHAKILSFGGGRHFCLGANLARLEARVALGELVRRFSRVEVDHHASVRFYSANVRGFAHVPMTAKVR
ncbi:cytochrome P450 [Nocardioides sp. CBS4Y-1]|uniref:Cytochrome P450 n=1 Tax=Nocardioides acrostichi TaxID=2784339 RepID=A0A930UYU6_9ACTN|nr:cytochrome P450 [Nocardioides acrostichi]